ncbi:hypothetical protein BBI01_18020 [Chryseobacterium artocarpi]|uniref:Uncharacterized protein n=1 Tax=Chryseobacterium artocarpi TaxID=1414727 RepID=A0A1B8ZC48_9FLAO|nr:hypothetical protein [Chryseobacterium artocarpi]OCA69106.1 hypothetical protein BBI01_18020 [Chryseobacterium artocarpi]
MKRVIPFLCLIMGLSIQSCRQSDEQLDGNFELSKVANESKRSADSTNQKVDLEFEKDPPVKDGQDWKH